MSQRFRIARLGYEITCDTVDDLTAAVTALGAVVDRKSYSIGVSTTGWKCTETKDAAGAVTREYTPNTLNDASKPQPPDDPDSAPEVKHQQDATDLLVKGGFTTRMRTSKPNSLSLSAWKLRNFDIFVTRLKHRHSRRMLRALMRAPDNCGSWSILRRIEPVLTVSVGRQVVSEFIDILFLNDLPEGQLLLANRSDTDYFIRLCPDFVRFLEFYPDLIAEPKSEADEEELDEKKEEPDEKKEDETQAKSSDRSSVFDDLFDLLAADSRLRPLFTHLAGNKHGRWVTAEEALTITGFPSTGAFKGALAALGRCCRQLGYTSGVLYCWSTSKADPEQKLIGLTAEFRNYLKPRKTKIKLS